MIATFARSWSSSPAQVYTVHAPPNPPADRIERAESLAFVKDGFSWGALFFGPFWLALKGHWLGLASYLLASIAIVGLLTLLEAGEAWISLSIIALNVFLAFEASSVQRLVLHRAGWEELGTVCGRDAGECERRFFEGWLPSQPMIAGSEASQTSGMLRATALDLGLAKAANGWRRLFPGRS